MHTLILVLNLLGQQQYSYLHLYCLIALAIACAITGHTCMSKNTDYCPNDDCSERVHFIIMIYIHASLVCTLLQQYKTLKALTRLRLLYLLALSQKQ